MTESNSILVEQLRIKAEYDRRESEIDQDLYAPWQAAEVLMTSERKRLAAFMLKDLNRFPKSGTRCLEVGYGKMGWLADLISWGVKESDLYGIELDSNRAARAQAALPAAHLEVGDATRLPWPDDFFDLVIVSTVFSSILDPSVRDLISCEIDRVLGSTGAVVIYDLRVTDPRNPNMLKVRKRDVRALFSSFTCRWQSLTLAPPIARLITGKSWTLATVLSSIPIFRTHLLGVLIKN